MVYAEFGGQTECIMGNWKIENSGESVVQDLQYMCCSRLYVFLNSTIFSITISNCSEIGPLFDFI